MSDAVARYYAEKTQRILRKYGPGPRVHFHAGFGAVPPVHGANSNDLRGAMFSAQERLISKLRVPWGARVIEVSSRVVLEFESGGNMMATRRSASSQRRAEQRGCLRVA